jgi:hypothetical protein
LRAEDPAICKAYRRVLSASTALESYCSSPSENVTTWKRLEGHLNLESHIDPPITWIQICTIDMGTQAESRPFFGTQRNDRGLARKIVVVSDDCF